MDWRGREEKEETSRGNIEAEAMEGEKLSRPK